MSIKIKEFVDTVSHAQTHHTFSFPGLPQPVLVKTVPPMPARVQITEPIQQLTPQQQATKRHEKQLTRLLNTQIIDLDKIRSIAWAGIPTVYRARVWRLFLDYEPINSEASTAVLSHKREDYFDCLERLFSPEQQPLWTTVQREIIRQIELDLPRTRLLAMEDERVQFLFKHVLFIWAVRHPASGYVQGMNDILVPFYIAFLQPFFPNLTPFEIYNLPNMNGISKPDLEIVEADCFWCFGKLLDGLQDVFTKDRTGLFRMLDDLSYLEQKCHPTFKKSLEQEEINYQDFAIPWMNCLLVREFKIPLLLRVWDLYLAQHQKVGQTVVYICSAMLDLVTPMFEETNPNEYREKLKILGPDFWTLDNLETILAQAYIIENNYPLDELRSQMQSENQK